MSHARHTASLAEAQAIEALPAGLLAECERAQQAQYWPLGLRCQILDAFDKARACQARVETLREVLHLSCSSQLSRWRRERARIMEAMEAVYNVKRGSK